MIDKLFAGGVHHYAREPMRAIECPECEGDCYFYTHEAAPNGDDYGTKERCDSCNGTGTVWKLCDTDGCNHQDCDEAARQEALRNAAAEAHENNAYDLEHDR